MSFKEWNQIVASNNGKIYHFYQWGSLIKKIHGHDLIYLQEKNGVFPLALVRSFIFGNRMISLPFADYGGLCATDEKTIDALIEKAEKVAEGLKVCFLEVRTPREDLIPFFERRGFIRRDDYITFIISLKKTLELLWKEIGYTNRSKVFRAKRNNIKIREAKNKSDLKIFYGLYLKTMKKLGSPVQPYAFFETLWDFFYPKNILILMAEVGNLWVAASLFLVYNETVHYVYGCSLSKEFLKLGAHNLIQWQIIKLAKKNGFLYYDLGRTRKNEAALFKKRLGGQEFPMPYFYKFYKKKLEQRQEVQYNRLANLWSKYLPEFIANRIGPWLIKQIG